MPDDAPATTAPETIPSRAQVPTDHTWDLTPLYPDDAAWEVAFREFEAAYPAFVRFKGAFTASAQTLLECLEAQRDLNLLSERLGHYAYLRVAEDGGNDPAQARKARLEQARTRAAETAAFFEPELLALPDERYEALAADPAFAPWRNALRKIRRFKPHILTEREERLLALCRDPIAGHHRAFSQLTNVDMTFGSLRDEKGRTRELSQSSFASFLMSRDPAVRRDAFHQFYREFADHDHTLAAMLSSSIKADVFEARARNHPSAIAAALFADDVPAAVYDNLIATVRRHLDPLFEYLELRRRTLGLDAIHHYDTYVPLVADIATDHPFEQAAELVLDSLDPLGPDYVSALREGIAARWIDRHENRGKRSGAFSSGSYGNPPFILMNYKRDVFAEVYTLAHEAGHSMHTWLSQRHQPFQDYDYPIFLAEVASTFNEELLTHHLLERTADRRMRAYIINRQIDDIRGTLYRQTMFAEFEKITHAMEESGEPLTLDSFRATYRRLLDDYFGPRFAIDPELELECLRIPHFYSAFYVYKYATGISAAMALASRVLNDPTTASRDAYLSFLASGGSLMPLDALRAAGVDMASPDPVENALGLFARRVEELARLL